MSRVRLVQATIIVLACISLFMTLDYYSSSPVLVDFHSKEPNNWIVRDSTRSPRIQFMLIVESQNQMDQIMPFLKEIEDREYGKWVKYEVEFLIEVYGSKEYAEIIETGYYMDVNQIVGGYNESEIQSVVENFVDESILITPSLSIDRTKIPSSQVISLYPNKTITSVKYAKLFLETGIEDYVVIGNETKLVDQICEMGGKVHENVLENELVKLEETINKLNVDSEIGVYTRLLTAEVVDILSILDDRKITVFCERFEKTDRKINIQSIFPKFINNDEYREFAEKYGTSRPENALIYDACVIIQLSAEETILRHRHNPEAIWITAQGYSGASGDCTLTPAGDRLEMEFILLPVVSVGF